MDLLRNGGGVPEPQGSDIKQEAGREHPDMTRLDKRPWEFKRKAESQGNDIEQLAGRAHLDMTQLERDPGNP